MQADPWPALRQKTYVPVIYTVSIRLLLKLGYRMGKPHTCDIVPYLIVILISKVCVFYFHKYGWFNIQNHKYDKRISSMIYKITSMVWENIQITSTHEKSQVSITNLVTQEFWNRKYGLTYLWLSRVFVIYFPYD